VIDCSWATIGSSNIDPFSLLLAREANIVVHDAPFATQLQASLVSAMARNGVAVGMADIGRRPWLTRVFSRLAYGAIRLMVGMTGYVGRREALK
jgi:cardiolipin synthase